jgi:hypothetical protein
MPSVAGALQPQGAVTELLVGLARADVRSLQQALRPVPQNMLLNALVDSGADSTCLDTAIVSVLTLPIASIGLINMPATVGLRLATMHRAEIILPHPSGNRSDQLCVGEVVVCDVPLKLLGFDAIIGRDILDILRFTYDGPARTFMLDWI